MNIAFTIPGRIPSKKNQRQIFQGNLVPSKNFIDWHRNIGLHLLGIPRLNGPAKEITITIWFPDKRPADLSNKTESIMDLLVDKGILVDDCWQITGPVHLIPGGIDREYPRAEVVIEC